MPTDNPGTERSEVLIKNAPSLCYDNKHKQTKNKQTKQKQQQQQQQQQQQKTRKKERKKERKKRRKERKKERKNKNLREHNVAKLRDGCKTDSVLCLIRKLNVDGKLLFFGLGEGEKCGVKLLYVDS